MIITKEAVSELARKTLCCPAGVQWSNAKVDSKCRSANACDSRSLEQTAANLIDNATPKHLLWGMLWMKVYSTEEVHCCIVGWPDPKTFRQWSWYFIKKIADLEASVILLDDRFKEYNNIATCLFSVDGTDCPVMEPHPEKMNGPGVKYEVGMCIKSGMIVWFIGPFVASTNDGTIFMNELAHLLCESEGVEVDAGYKGHGKLKKKMISISREQRKQKSAVRARHESINSRLKQFNVLNFSFRHLNLGSDDMMFKHDICFGAIVVITHLKMIAREGNIYDVE
jgi:hypothetical protein